MNFLMVDEIDALEKLIKLSGQDWFSIRSPNYLWDKENMVRLGIKDGVREFLSCVESHVKELTPDEQDVIKTLWDEVNKVEFDFEGVESEY